MKTNINFHSLEESSLINQTIFIALLIIFQCVQFITIFFFFIDLFNLLQIFSRQFFIFVETRSQMAKLIAHVAALLRSLAFRVKWFARLR